MPKLPQSQPTHPSWDNLDGGKTLCTGIIGQTVYDDGEPCGFNQGKRVEPEAPDMLWGDRPG